MINMEGPRYLLFQRNLLWDREGCVNRTRDNFNILMRATGGGWRGSRAENTFTGRTEVAEPDCHTANSRLVRGLAEFSRVGHSPVPFWKYWYCDIAEGSCEEAAPLTMARLCSCRKRHRRTPV